MPKLVIILVINECETERDGEKKYLNWINFHVLLLFFLTTLKKSLPLMLIKNFL